MTVDRKKLLNPGEKEGGSPTQVGCSLLITGKQEIEENFLNQIKGIYENLQVTCLLVKTKCFLLIPKTSWELSISLPPFNICTEGASQYDKKKLKACR